MRQILLSPEFQLFSPFFIIFLLILLVSIAFLILRIIAVYNEVKSRKLLEKLFNETDGGDTMKPLDGKTILEQALQGLTPTDASGNQTALVQFLASAAQGFANQSTGALQKLQQLAMVKAASEAMRTGEQINESLDSHIQAAQGQFDEETPRQVADALGNATPEQNSLEGSSAESASQVNVGTPVEISPGTSTEVNQETEEAFVRGLIASPDFREHLLPYFTTSGKAVDIDNGYRFSDIPKNLFDNLYGYFNGRKSDGGNYKRAYDFLQRVKSERNGA